MNRSLLFGSLLLAGTAFADNRIFTYNYEPETEPKGDWELEQSITSRLLRDHAVGQANYQLWQFSTEVEHGVTDRYTTSLKVNDDFEHFRDPASGQISSVNRFSGVASENRFLVLNPVENPVGLTLYLEPTYDGQNAELEQKVILGQRSGDWKWAVNLTHATEWTDNFNSSEGEVELSAGLARQLNHRWTIGLEVRDHNELPNYQQWENTAIYLGPTVSYRRSSWWTAFSVMPQIYGANYTGNPGQNTHLELEGHERFNLRLLVGYSF